MESMFSGKGEKQIPKTLSECIKSDSTATDLYRWSERLESLGYILFIILILVGIISTISNTSAMVDLEEDMAFTTFFTSAITWTLYAFIEYCAYHVLSLLLRALASITQNTIISANVALLNANADSNAAGGQPIIAEQKETKINTSSTIRNYGNYECGKCGASGPYEGNCPNCGSSLKIYKN